MDFATVIKFLVPALKAILPMIPASTPAGRIAQDVLKLLPMFGHPATAGYGAAPPPSLPPESEWTPEGLLRHYGARPTVSDPDSPKPS